MSHKATVIVYFRRRTNDTVQAYLVKHPNRSPRRISLKSTTGGNGLGRITLPFRTILQQEMDNLKRTYREALMHAGRRDAFDSLTRAWSSEQGAMSHAKVPTALDVMLLTAVVDNRRLIEDIYDQLEAVSPKLDRTNARSNDYRD